MIFGTMHLLGFSYAPRIKNLKRQRLYTFKSRKTWDRAQVKVTPSGYIDTQVIEDNWDDILRFIATIKLKETTASEIFRRLNSYSKQHALYRALKTFGKIIKSIFILRYIDDLELRQAIEKQLNKIENSHQFSRAVSNRKSKGVYAGGKARTGSGRGLQTPHQKCHHVLELSLLVPENQ